MAPGNFSTWDIKVEGTARTPCRSKAIFYPGAGNGTILEGIETRQHGDYSLLQNGNAGREEDSGDGHKSARTALRHKLKRTEGLDIQFPRSFKTGACGTGSKRIVLRKGEIRWQIE
jgi:hypothetical protein